MLGASHQTLHLLKHALVPPRYAGTEVAAGHAMFLVLRR
jgi:hypothetical protein